MFKLLLRRNSTKGVKPTVSKPAAAGELQQGELWLNNHQESPALYARAADDTLIEFKAASAATTAVAGIDVMKWIRTVTGSGTTATATLSPAVATDGLDVPRYAVGGVPGVDHSEVHPDVYGGNLQKTWQKGILIQGIQTVGQSFTVDGNIFGGANAFILAIPSAAQPIDIDWGDGTKQRNVTTSVGGKQTHAYAATGKYTIKVTQQLRAGIAPVVVSFHNYKPITRFEGASPGLVFAGDRSNWFAFCEALEYVGSLTLGAVTSLNGAFNTCTKLKELPPLDCGLCTDMADAWSKCAALVTMHAVDTSSCTTLYRAWFNCTSLANLPWMPTLNVTNFESAWSGCSALNPFPFIDTSKGTNFANTWTSCRAMTPFPALNFASGVNFNGAWMLCQALTSFPAVRFPVGSNFARAWQNCDYLAAFPAITFPAGTNFTEAWQACPRLATFPAGVFNTTGTLAPTAFANAFKWCAALTAASVENILVSLDTNGQSNITLGIGGVAESAWTPAAKTAKANLITKGWTITHV